MTVSVLISIYSGTCCEQLVKCYESIAGQTYDEIEIITVCDGPISVELLEVSKKYSNKCVVLKTNNGLGAALNAGIQACSYDLVARIDCDDVMCESRISLQVDYLLENPQVGVVGGCAITTSLLGRRQVQMVPTGLLKNHDFWLRNPVIHPSVMFRKHVIVDAGGYPCLRYTQDFVLWIRLQSIGINIHNINKILIEFNPEGYKFRGLSEFIRVIPAYRELYETGLVPKYKIVLGLILRACFYFISTIVHKLKTIVNV